MKKWSVTFVLLMLLAGCLSQLDEPAGPPTSPPDETLLPPALVSPANAASGLAKPVSLRWNRARSATGYVVEVRQEVSTQPSLMRVTSDTTLTVPDSLLELGERYAWRVASLKANVQSNWSEQRTFSLQGSPTLGRVRLLQPPNGALNLPVSFPFSWEAVAGASAYELRIRTALGPILPYRGITGTSVILPNPLSPNTQYWWEVRAVSLGARGEWSELWRLQTGTDTTPGVPFVDIWASADTVNPGATVTFNWTSLNCEQVSIPLFGGLVEPVGSRTQMLNQTTQATIYGYVGNVVRASDSVTVYVRGLPAIELSVSVTPSTITQGDSSTLRITWANGDSAVLRGYGHVGQSFVQWVKPLTTTTYIVDVYRGGVIGRTGSATLTVLPLQPVYGNITANPLIILSGGVTTVSWTSTGADSAWVEPFGRVGLNGSRPDTLFESQTYRLKLWKNGVIAFVDSVTVIVQASQLWTTEIFLDQQFVAVDPLIPSQATRRLTFQGGYIDFDILPHGTNWVHTLMQVSYSLPGEPGQTYEVFRLGWITPQGDTNWIYQPGSDCPIVGDSIGGTFWRDLGFVQLPNHPFRMVLQHGVMDPCDGITWSNVPPGSNSVQVGTSGGNKLHFKYEAELGQVSQAKAILRARGHKGIRHFPIAQ